MKSDVPIFSNMTVHEPDAPAQSLGRTLTAILANCVWYYQNDKKANVTFISRAVPISAKGFAKLHFE